MKPLGLHCIIIIMAELYRTSAFIYYVANAVTSRVHFRVPRTIPSNYLIPNIPHFQPRLLEVPSKSSFSSSGIGSLTFRPSLKVLGCSRGLLLQLVIEDCPSLR